MPSKDQIRAALIAALPSIKLVSSSDDSDYDGTYHARADEVDCRIVDDGKVLVIGDILSDPFYSPCIDLDAFIDSLHAGFHVQPVS